MQTNFLSCDFPFSFHILHVSTSCTKLKWKQATGDIPGTWKVSSKLLHCRYCATVKIINWGKSIPLPLVTLKNVICAKSATSEKGENWQPFTHPVLKIYERKIGVLFKSFSAVVKKTTQKHCAFHSENTSFLGKCQPREEVHAENISHWGCFCPRHARVSTRAWGTRQHAGDTRFPN